VVIRNLDNSLPPFWAGFVYSGGFLSEGRLYFFNQHYTQEIIMKKTFPFLSIVIAIFLSVIFIGAIANSSSAAGPNQGYVIIQPDPNQRSIREISFSSNINGIQALELANQDVITSSTAFGVAVCSIAGVGCPADNCFCSTAYWEYSYWDGSAWQGYPTGAGDTSLSDGAIEGWHWGECSRPPLN
jgi:hypothetical protein